MCLIYKLHGDVPHHKRASTFHVFDGDEDRLYSSSELERHLMVASASIKLDKLSISWLGSNAIYESVMRIIALVVGNAAPMPGKNGIRPSADQTRSRTDNRDGNGDGVGRREDRRRGSSPSPLLSSS